MSERANEWMCVSDGGILIRFDVRVCVGVFLDCVCGVFFTAAAGSFHGVWCMHDA